MCGTGSPLVMVHSPTPHAPDNNMLVSEENRFVGEPSLDNTAINAILPGKRHNPPHFLYLDIRVKQFLLGLLNSSLIESELPSLIHDRISKPPEEHSLLPVRKNSRLTSWFIP
jgi:hypothetical protein